MTVAWEMLAGRVYAALPYTDLQHRSIHGCQMLVDQLHSSNCHEVSGDDGP
jgi:hypothetical protein